MKPMRAELCVSIPGPKTVDEPLEKIEEFALNRLNPAILIAVQSGDIKRIIDYMGNYFLIFPDKERTE